MIPLDTLTDGVLACVNCDLRRDDEEPVPGLGPGGGVMVVGDFPGPEAALMGRPFEDRPGLIVRRMLKTAGIPEAATRFTYAIHCRPDKKGPKAAHIKACRTWLMWELEAARPKVVVALGLLPSRMLGLVTPKEKLAEVAGRVGSIAGIPAVVWHGASVIMNGGWKTDRDTTKLFTTLKGYL